MNLRLINRKSSTRPFSDENSPNGAALSTTAARHDSPPPESRPLERRQRGRLVRRALLLTDAVGLALAFLIAQLTFGGSAHRSGSLTTDAEVLLFFLSIPAWLLLAALHGLYHRDEERIHHSTADELGGVLHVVTGGTLLFLLAGWLTGLAQPTVPKLIALWLLASTILPLARVLTRAACRRRASYLENTLIVGVGPVGQLVNRKLLRHSEFGNRVVGFVDSLARERRANGDISLIGPPDQLLSLIARFSVDRVVVACPDISRDELDFTLDSLAKVNVQVDIVPAAFRAIGSTAAIYALEDLPILSLRASPPARPPLSKRMLDIALASLALVLAAPFFALAAFLIRRDTPGPVFFRQTRLGLNMREFEMLKFRTMKVGTSDAVHREYLKAITELPIPLSESGLYKAPQDDSVTPFGRWLRSTSLDELPQLINVLRGDMSLVGPRPCLTYEIEHYAPHHFERFLMPPGITGLWQATARGHATPIEALDMDVTYVRSQSFGFDLALIIKTPLQVLRRATV